MARSVAYYPDRSPVEFVYTDENGESTTYQYKRLHQAVVDGERKTNVLVPKSNAAKNPPRLVMEKMEEYDLTVEPPSYIDEVIQAD